MFYIAILYYIYNLFLICHNLASYLVLITRQLFDVYFLMHTADRLARQLSTDILAVLGKTKELGCETANYF